MTTSISHYYPTALPYAPPTRQWDIGRYISFLFILGIVSIPFILFGSLAQMPLLAAFPIALGVLGLTAVKPEAGLLVMLILMPMEDAMEVIPGSLTVIRTLGFFVLAVFLLHGLMGQGIVLNNPFIKRQSLLVLAMFVSILLSNYPLAAMSGMQTQVAFLLFTILAISLIRDWRMVDNAIVFLFLGGVIAAVFGLWLEFTGAQSLASIERGGRLSLAEEANPNAYSRAVGICLVTMPYVWARFRGPIIKAMLVFSAIFMIGAIIKAQTRSVWITLAAALPLAFWFAEPRITARAAKMLVMITVVAVVLMVAVESGFIGEKIIKRFQTIEEGVHAGGRIDIWRVAFYAFLDNPLFGLGYGVFGYDSLNVASRHGLTLPGFYSRDVHNNYFFALADLGLAGTLAFAALLWYLGKNLAIFPKGPLRGALIGMFIFDLLGGLTGTTINGKTFWFSVIVIAAAITVNARQKESTILSESYTLEGSYV